jgi:hypothetical protein
MQKFIESSDKSFVGRMLSFGPRLWYDEDFDASKLWDGVEVPLEQESYGAPCLRIMILMWL